jgi:exopolyphosphatase / guanosine-5'-triphosphate,3'-diphosphate pyrophosphatase
VVGRGTVRPAGRRDQRMTRVAAIDCGTNSIRLLVADVPPEGRHTDLLRRMEVVRLGEGVDATGRLAPEAIERTRKVLVEYVVGARDLGATAVRMVATSATRDAANRAEFEDMVVEVLGQRPDVVAGTEEAELSFIGATASLDAAAAAHGAEPPRPPFLVVDIGGGSTEFVLGDATGVRAAHSVDIGCVRLTERHLHGDPPSAAQVRRAEDDIRAALAEVRALVPVAEAASLIGLAGSVTTVAALALALAEYDPVAIHGSCVAVDGVREVTAFLLAATRAHRATLPVMHPGRVDVIGAGALILRVIMDEFGLPQVVVSEHDILDGIALRLARG